jgi:hypothetical protein
VKYAGNAVRSVDLSNNKWVGRGMNQIAGGCCVASIVDQEIGIS